MYLERGSDSSMGNSKYRLTIESTEPSLQLSYQIYVTPGSIQESKFNSSEDVVFRFVLQVSPEILFSVRDLDCIFGRILRDYSFFCRRVGTEERFGG